MFFALAILWVICFKSCIFMMGLLEGLKFDKGVTISEACIYSSNSLSLVLAKKASRSLSEKLFSFLDCCKSDSSSYLCKKLSSIFGISLLGVASLFYLYP